MRKKSRRPFDPFTGLEAQAILVMKAAENRVGDYVVTVTNPMIVQHGSDVGAIVRVSLPDRPAWRRLW